MSHIVLLIQRLLVPARTPQVHARLQKIPHQTLFSIVLIIQFYDDQLFANKAMTHVSKHTVFYKAACLLQRSLSFTKQPAPQLGTEIAGVATHAHPNEYTST
jgi:hypothetical protein